MTNTLQREKFIGTIGYLGGVMAVPEPFAWSWGSMLVYSHEALCESGEHIYPDHTGFSLHDYARNDLLGRMRGDWMLMLDTDIAFEPDLAARMVSAMYRYDVDVLTGIYCYKAPPNFPVLYMYNHATQKNEIVANWDRTAELFRIDSAGGGVLLFRRQVCERITAELKERPFSRIGDRGEDHSFFTRLRTLGIKAYCAPQIEVQHLKYHGLLPSVDYEFTGQATREFTTEEIRIAAQ